MLLPHRYLAQAVKKGPYVVDIPDAASVVLVDDYCHKLQWLASTHSENGAQARHLHLGQTRAVQRRCTGDPAECTVTGGAGPVCAAPL